MTLAMISYVEMRHHLRATLNTADLSRLSQQEGVDRALEETDAAVQDLVEHQRRLREHRNSVVPIARLPPEILSFIFKHHTHWASCWSNREHFLAFSHVCRRWRYVAIEDPSLWVEPFFKLPRLGEMMLTRARTLPIVVTAECAESEDQYRLLTLAFKKHSQISEIDLGANAEQAQRLFQMITGPMPLLTSMKLCTSGSAYLHNDQRKQHQFPSLRKLYLEGCVPHPHARCLRNLTKLKIDLEYCNSIQMSIPRLIAVLQLNPRLEKLVLVHAALKPESQLFSRAPSQRTQLKYLGFFELDEDVDAMTLIFRYLDMPRLKYLQLSNAEEEEQPGIEAITRLFHALKAWRETTARQLHYVMFCTNDDGHLECGAGYFDGLSPPNGVIPLRVTIVGPNENHRDIMSLMTSLLKTPAARTVCVDWKPSDIVPLDSVMELILAAPRVHTIQLREYAFKAFLVALESRLRRGERPLPSMKLLELMRCFMYTKYCEPKASLLHRFAEALNQLKAGGVPLSRLWIINPLCRTDPHEVLEGLGLDLEIHGSEIIADDLAARLKLADTPDQSDNERSEDDISQGSEGYTSSYSEDSEDE